MKFHILPMYFFAMKWRPTWYKMVPDKLENGAQKLKNGVRSVRRWCPICVSKFDCRSFISKIFVKEVCILLASFTLSHFHKSNPTLLQVFQPSVGVTLNVRFTTNGMWVKNTNHIHAARTSNDKVRAACDLCCYVLQQCEALHTSRSGFLIVTKWCCDQDAVVYKVSIF